MRTASTTRATVTRRRGAALYIAVMATALLVTLLGLAGLSQVQVQRREVVELTNRIAAREAANSAAELALVAIDRDNDWRTTYTSGQESAALSLGGSRGATVSWVISDADGDLTNRDIQLRLAGVGRVGDAVQVSTRQIRAEAVGPSQLANQTSTWGQASVELKNNKSWCQYIHPDLPNDTLAWRVTRVEFYCRKDHGDRALDMVLYEPSVSNWPTSVVIDAVATNSDSFSSSWSWQGVDFGGSVSVAPDQGVCIALTTSENKSPINLAHLTSGVSESNAALITGSPDWDGYAANQAIRYRLYGEYFTEEAPCEPVDGTWEWGALP